MKNMTKEFIQLLNFQCRHPAETLKIRAGEWDTQSEREAFPHQDLGVGAVVVHEQFYSASFENDYAILVLSQPVKLTETVNVICLPEQDVQFDQARCTATGWGKNVFGEEHCFKRMIYLFFCNFSVR